MSLAKKLIKGNDPLNGISIEKRLEKFNVTPITEIISFKNEVNNRNKELVINKNIASS